MESWCVGYDGNDDVERHARIGDEGDSEPMSLGQGPSPDSSVAKRHLRLNVVSDYICPWCYIGFTRVERLREDFDIEFETCAYELRPGIPLEGIARAELNKDRVYPPGYIDNLIATAADCGIEMKRPDLVPNTRLAHEATEFAKEHGKLWEIHRVLFHAYFEEARNIGDIEVVVDVCGSIGLDRDAARTALATHRYATAVQQQLDWSRAVGVTGVPTAIFNEKFALVGAQDYEAVRDIARRVVERELSAL